MLELTAQVALRLYPRHVHSDGTSLSPSSTMGIGVLKPQVC